MFHTLFQRWIPKSFLEVRVRWNAVPSTATFQKIDAILFLWSFACDR